MRDVVIAGYARTAVGKLGGKLSGISAVDLGARAIACALERAHIPADQVDQVIMGTVLAAGLGQVPARQAALGAGIPVEASALTVNKVCASGLKAVNLGALLIKTGEAGVVVTGGMESMSRAPYLAENARFGYRMGDAELVDSMVRDGLHCPVGDVPMHVYGSDVAAEYNITREDQDRWAVESQQRYERAREAGRIQEEIVGVDVPARGGDERIDEDEQPRPGTNYETLSRLKPLKPGGSVTAGNAPGVNDGAAALVLTSAERARDMGLHPLAIVIASGEANAEAPYLHTVPAQALRRALGKTDIEISDIDLFEINEAFAAVTLTSMRLLGIDEDRVNVNGGAVAIGHPVGASGARILGSLVLEMNRRGVDLGAASICSGLAQGEATIVRRCS